MKNIAILILATLALVVNVNAQDKMSGKKGGKKGKANSGYQIGDKVEDFSLENIDGTKVSLSQFDNAKGYIIVFTSNVCPFAVASEDKLVELNNKMSPLGYPLIAINSNEASADNGENMADMQALAKEKSFTFPYLKDNDGVYAKFGATKTPHAFLIDGEMTLRYMGSIDDNPRSPEEVTEEYLMDAVDALINNRTPEPAVTKSIGCPIKRGGKAGGKGRKGPPNPKALMEKMDADKDGKIAKSEAEGRLADDFDRMDANSDGTLTIEELTNGFASKKKH